MRVGWMSLLFIVALLMPAAVQAQNPACTWPSDATFYATNPNRDYVAWADGSAIFWMRCVDLVTIQMFTGSTPTGLYFDGTWLPYILHYFLADGSHWQISVVSPHDPYMITPPTNPLVTDTPGEAHADTPVRPTATSSPPTVTPMPVGVLRQPYPVWFWLRQLFRHWFQ